MKRETIKQIIVTADDGKYLTNGETYGKTVVLPESADVSAWHEITDAEYEEIIKAQEESIENEQKTKYGGDSV